MDNTFSSNLYYILYYTREQGVGITLAWSSLKTPSLVGFGIEAFGHACPLLSIGHRTAKIATVASNGIYRIGLSISFHYQTQQAWFSSHVLDFEFSNDLWSILNQENFLKDIHTVYTSIYSTVHIQQGAVIQYLFQILPYPGVS